MFSEIKKSPHMAVVTANEGRAAQRDVYVPPDQMGMAHFSHLSPDRQQVLIVEMRRGWTPCRLVPFDGSSSGREVGPDPGHCTAAAWSPDGKWMYFTADTGQGLHIWRQLTDGGKPEQLTFGPTEEQGIAVSPDGRSIYTAAGTTLNSVWIHDAKGDRQISGEGSASHPVLTADGRKAYYGVSQRGANELWVADLETGRSEPALPGIQIPLGWSVSPDGKTVGYRDDKLNLWVAPLDRSSSPRNLSINQTTGVSLDNSGHIFYAVPEGAEHYLYRMNLDGSDRQKAFSQLLLGAWSVSPDGKWLATTPGGRIVKIYSSDGDPVAVCTHCAAGWAADGASLLINFPVLAGRWTKRTQA